MHGGSVNDSDFGEGCQAKETLQTPFTAFPNGKRSIYGGPGDTTYDLTKFRRVGT